MTTFSLNVPPTKKRRQQSIIVILRRAYLDIVGNNHCAAKLIDFFSRWQKFKQKTHRTDWIYMPLKYIHEDLMGEHSLHVIRAAIAKLEGMKIVERRANPSNRQDKTWQYKLNTSILEHLLQESRTLKNEHSEITVEQQHPIPSQISDPLSFPPNPPEEPERERENLASTPESAEIDWDAIRTQMNHSHQQSLLEHNSPLISSLVEEPPKFEAHLKDPWLDQPCGASLLNDEKKKQVDLTSDSDYPKLDNLLGVHVERKQEKVEVCRGEASPQETSMTSERLQSDVSPRPFMKRPKYVWEVEPGKPIPEFQNWWAKTHYEPQGGHWATGAYGHAYSEFYNKPEKTTNATFPQFMAVHQVVAQNCQQQQFIGQQGVLPSYFALPPAPSENNMHQLATTFRELVSNGARVALPQGIATPSCQQSVSWSKASSTAIAPLPTLCHVLAGSQQPAQMVPGLADQVERKRLAWKVPILRDGIKKWVEATDGVELDDDGPCLV